jgi:hypothetical protein
MYPATIITVVFVDRAVAAILKPNAMTVALLAAVVMAAVGVVLYFRRRLLALGEATA